MNFEIPKRRSLKTRLTLFTLAVFLLGIWTLSLFASQALHRELKDVLGAQQRSTVSLLAAQINAELEQRFAGLNDLAIAAAQTGTALNAPSVQALLEHRPATQRFFNGGILVLDAGGTAIADVPLSTGRVGLNYADVDTVAAALLRGQQTVGKPVVGRVLKAPLFGMTVPIRNAQGKVIGAVYGVTNLGKPSFLDKVTQSPYGKSGGFYLTAPQLRLSITATDKRFIMRDLPPAGESPAIDKLVSGWEGTQIYTNLAGEEALASARTVPLANWALVARLPTAEAFEPIRTMQKHVLLAALVVTLIVAGLTFWFLGQALTPLVGAANALVQMNQSGGMPQALHVSREDEVGQLIQGFNHMIQQVVERDARLRESEALLRGILDSVGSEVAVLDHEGVIRMVNEPWLRFAQDNSAPEGQLSTATGIGANYLSACRQTVEMSSHGAQNASVGISSVLDGKIASFELEYPCHSPLQKRWFRMNVTRLESTLMPGVVVCHSDITQRVQSELRARESNDFIGKLVDVIPGMVGYWSTDLRCRFANTGYLAWFGRTPDNMHNIRIQDLLGPELFAKNETYIRGVLAGEAQHFERKLVKADGSVGHTLAHYIPDSRDGKLVGFFAVVSDVTALKLTQLQLEESNNSLQLARDAAQAANSAKSQFLTHMSHELRTPLNSILGFAQLLDHNASLPDTEKDKVGEILSAGYHLLQLVKDILDLAKIEAGTLTVSMESVEMDGVVQECIHRLSTLADMHHITVAYTPSHGAEVWADRTRLCQVLLNLLSNAIKYNREQGSVLITIRPNGEDLLQLVVTDSGTGISPAQLVRLFEPFNRLGVESTGIEGTGVGLSIARKLALLMGGTIGVTSAVGTGSSFWVELARAPLESVDPASGVVLDTRFPMANNVGTPFAGHAHLQTKTVLYVEDNPINLRLVTEILKRRPGVNVLGTMLPREGISLALAHRPALILLDINMPEMDGFAVLRTIRAEPSLVGVTVIALSANAMPHDVELGLASGFDDYLTKPLDVKKLSAVVDRVLG